MILNLIISNWLPILLGVGGAIFGGKIYLKGRAHAKRKADREQFEALDRVERDVARAVTAGDDTVSGKLHDDDGFKRSD